MRGAILLLLIAGVAFPLVVGYHTEPRTAAQSGWAHRDGPHDYVSQVVTVNFDELDSAAGGCYVGGDFGDTLLNSSCGPRVQ